MPRKKQDPTDLSIEKMEEKLAEMDVHRARLEAALEDRRAAELSAFVEAVREQIKERGYSVPNVIALLSEGRKRTTRRASVQYSRYIDPDDPNNSYSRGPLPAWLRQKMEAAGYDAGDKAHREEFKANYLEQVA
jgi:DNA-binding protein H-NS